MSDLLTACYCPVFSQGGKSYIHWLFKKHIHTTAFPGMFEIWNHTAKIVLSGFVVGLFVTRNNKISEASILASSSHPLSLHRVEELQMYLLFDVTVIRHYWGKQSQNRSHYPQNSFKKYNRGSEFRWCFLFCFGSLFLRIRGYFSHLLTNVLTLIYSYNLFFPPFRFVTNGI